jgi:hypothetical protein
MILSNELLFSDAQDIVTTSTKTASTNVIDLGLQGTPHGDAAALTYDFGFGHSIPLLLMVNETFDAGTNDHTVTIAFEQDSTTTFTPDVTVDLGTFAEATLVAGYTFPLIFVPTKTTLRYCRIAYTVAGTGNFTAGQITAAIVPSLQQN